MILSVRWGAGGFAHVRVAQRGDRHRHPGARRLVVSVAHERSPIQKQMTREAPDPDEQGHEALGHRTDPAERKAAGVDRVLQAACHVPDDVGHLLVGQVAREARHVGRPDTDGLGDLLRRHVSVLQRRSIVP